MKHHSLARIGPGLITAAVVLGPGSIVSSCRAGAESGYSLVWLLALACLFMATFTAMGARLGCTIDETPLQFIARHRGRIPAAFLGSSAFLVAAGFQFGNNIGVSVAMSGLTGLPKAIWPAVFTALALVFMWRARSVYLLLERLMIALVAIMITAFCANLAWIGVRWPELASGFVPRAPAEHEGILMRAMMGTTFSAVAAFCQAYLVKAKGWRKETVGIAIGDAWIGIGILGSMALVILMGAAGALHGSGADFTGIGRLAEQLRGALGPWALVVFSLGLAAASFSSFIANALIGGALMAEGLGQRSQPESTATRVWTSVGMLTGGIVATATFLLGRGSTTSLLIAQAATLIAAPFCALTLYALTSSRRVMGPLKNGPAALVLGAIGLGVVAWLNVDLLLRLSD